MSATSFPVRSQHNHTAATHPALHLRDARDAHIVFEAVRLKILPLVTRRLTAIEREQLTSGNVFVWEEAEHKQGGLERWTDGRRWSQSRMRGDYLFYEEKIETTPEEREAKAARRARKTLDPFGYQPAPTRRQDRPSKPDGLTKQTYSTHVYLGSSEPPRKWHIVAYFSGDDYTCLPVIENYEYLRNIHVPDGVYSSAKGNIGRVTRVLSGDDNDTERYSSPSPPGWVSPSWPPSITTTGLNGPFQRPLSSSSSSSGSPVSTHHFTAAPFSPEAPTLHRDGSLPRLASIAPVQLSHPLSSLQPPGSRHNPSYAPLTPEDRRALNSFRVVL
ncbi:hypothetical protein QCA50_019171 [Cerrena zonata]|uniref:cAMP-independent regulatory protein pac2 n=1 Tax=Cerrena zonata TaxID=2478898 RepID=A0AAW0FI75_9APHY